MIIAWSHTHTLHKVKVGTGTFCFAPFDFMDNSLVQLQAKKKTFAKKRFSFYVSFIQHCFFLSGIVWAAAQNPRAFLPQLKKNSPSTIFDFTTSTWMRGCILSYPVPEKEKKGFIYTMWILVLDLFHHNFCQFWRRKSSNHPKDIIAIFLWSLSATW